MKIERIEIRNFNRVSSDRNIGLKNMSYAINNDIQIITGANGCGKSSLMACLLLGTYRRNEFGDDGYIIVYLNYNSTDYVVSNRVKGKSVKYSVFNKTTNTELNEPGQARIQSELIETIFGLDNMTRGLMLNRHGFSFTTMTPQMRRNWVMKLSKIDLDLAMTKYRKSKDTLTYITNISKHTTQKLSSLVSKGFDNKEEERLRERLEVLSDNISELNKINRVNYKKPLIGETMTKFRTLMRSYHTTTSYQTTIEEHGLPFGQREREGLLNRLTEEIVLLEYEIKKGNTEINKLADIVEHGIDESAIGKIVEKQQTIKNILKNNGEIDIPVSIELLKFISDIETDLLRHLDNMNPVEDIDKHMNKYQTIQEECVVLDESIHELDKKLSVEKALLDEYKSHEGGNEITCPSCDHVFIDGYTRSKHMSLSNSIVKDEQALSTMTKMVKTRKRLIADWNTLNDDITRYSGVINLLSTPIAKDLLCKLNDMEFYSNPKAAYKLVTDYKSDIDTGLENIRLREELVAIKKDMDLNATVRDKHELFIEELDKKKTLINNAVVNLSKKMETKGVLENINKTLKKRKELAIIIAETNKKIGTEVSEYTDSIVATVISESIKEYTKETNDIRIKLSTITNIRERIKETEGEVEQHNKRKEVLTVLTKELSPTKGFIASAIRDEMISLLNKVNVVINEIWDYDLRVEQGKEINGELDYNFVIMKGDTEHGRVSDGSSGMQEIIDLAFKIVIMDCMGINTYPMILDEFGTHFDPDHKVRSYDYLLSMLAQREYSNVFIISHNRELHSIFDSSSTIVNMTNKETSSL